MPEERFRLLGPGGVSAVVSLSNNISVAGLRPQIAQAVGLPKWRKLVVRDQDGRLLNEHMSLTTSGVSPDEIVVVEPVSGSQLLRRAVSRQEPPEMLTSAYPVLPCYLVVDTSQSMSDGAIDEINAEIPELQKAMFRQPMLVDSCHLSLIGFDATAKVHFGLADVSKMYFRPLRADVTRTAYSEAFKLLRSTISNDLYELYRSGRRPYRPVVFFLSDGDSAENDQWRSPLDELTDPAKFYGAPHILAFGFGNAVEKHIWEVGRTAAFMPGSGGPAANLTQVMKFMLNSITNSITQAGQDQRDVLKIPPRQDKDWEWMQIR